MAVGGRLLGRAGGGREGSWQARRGRVKAAGWHLLGRRCPPTAFTLRLITPRVSGRVVSAAGGHLLGVCVQMVGIFWAGGACQLPSRPPRAPPLAGAGFAERSWRQHSTPWHDSSLFRRPAKPSSSFCAALSGPAGGWGGAALHPGESGGREPPKVRKYVFVFFFGPKACYVKVRCSVLLWPKACYVKVRLVQRPIERDFCSRVYGRPGEVLRPHRRSD